MWSLFTVMDKRKKFKEKEWELKEADLKTEFFECSFKQCGKALCVEIKTKDVIRNRVSMTCRI